MYLPLSAPVYVPALAHVTRVWIGASVAIGIEAGSKFQAKSLTRPVALDVGRHVFFSQLCFEGLLAAAATWISLRSEGIKTIPASLAVSIGAWFIQLFVLYPKLNQKAIEAPTTPARKDAVHNVYVTLEAIKLAGLFYLI